VSTEQNGMAIRANRHRNMVCVFKRGPKLTHYVGISGPQLAVCTVDNDHFEREFSHIPVKKVAGVDLEYTPVDFATSYMKAEARKMLPIAPSALRVLTAILRGSQSATDDEDGAGDSVPASSHMEQIMTAAKDEGFRKPDGPVATIHKYLDSRFNDIRKGVVGRKELIETLIANGSKEGTAVTQTGVWARNNGISFAAVKKKLKETPSNGDVNE